MDYAFILFCNITVKIDIHKILSLLPIVVIGVASGTILHEVGHKFMAMRYGYQSEFKLWPIGLLIGFATAFFWLCICSARYR